MEELKAIAILKGRLRELKSARKIVDMQNSQLKLDKPIENIEEALFELEGIQDIILEKDETIEYLDRRLNNLRILFYGEFTICNHCGNYKRVGFNCGSCKGDI